MSRTRLSGEQSQTIIIPEMNFTCKGTIMAVRIVGRQQNGPQSPRLQLWTTTNNGYFKRKQQTMLNLSVCSDHSQGENISFGKDQNSMASEFECKLKRKARLLFQTGDIIGFNLPHKNDDNFELYFTNFESGPTNYIYTGRKQSYATDGYKSNVIQHPQIWFTKIVTDPGTGIYECILF